MKPIRLRAGLGTAGLIEEQALWESFLLARGLYLTRRGNSRLGLGDDVRIKGVKADLKF